MVSAHLAVAIVSALSVVSSALDVTENQAVCPPGYKDFERENGKTWCLKYFEGNQTFFEAEKICRCQGGATLSGLENYQEYKYVTGQVEASFYDNEIQNGGVWLGAYRRAACRGEKSKWEKKAECSPKLMFQWTDRNTVGTLNFERWMPNAPHSVFVDKVQENCVQLLVSTEENGEKADLSGMINDKVCTMKGSPDGNDIFVTRGFVCGRPGLDNGDCDESGIFPIDGPGYDYLIGAGKPKAQ